MKKIYSNLFFVFLFLFLVTLPAFAQIRWSAGFDIDIQKDAIVFGSKKTSDLFYDYSFDSRKDTYEVIREISLYNKYAQFGTGFKVYAQRHSTITKKFNFVMGIGLDYSSFYVNTVYTSIDKTSTLLKTETVDSVPPYGLQNVGYPEYEVNDIWNQNNSIRIFNLYIPVELDFELFQNFRVFAGGKLNKPIYATYASGKTVIDLSDKGYGSTVTTLNDKSRDAISTFSFEGFGGIKYRFANRFELSLSASKHLTSVLREPKHNQEKGIFQKNDFRSYKPNRFSIGVSYFFATDRL